LLFSVFSVPSVVNNQSNFVPFQSPHFDAIALPRLQSNRTTFRFTTEYAKLGFTLVFLFQIHCRNRANDTLFRRYFPAAFKTMPNETRIFD